MTNDRDLPFSKKPDTAAIAAAERELDRDADVIGEVVSNAFIGDDDRFARQRGLYGQHELTIKALEARRLLDIAIAALDDAGCHQTALLIKRGISSL